MFTTLLIVAGVCLACYALVWGKRTVETERLNDDPSALVVRVGNAQVTRQQVDGKMIQTLRSRIEAKSQISKHVRGVYPYRTCVDRIDHFRLLDSKLSLLTGRTVRAGADVDFFVAGQTLHRGVLPTGTISTDGIVIGPRGMNKLGLSTETPLPVELVASIGDMEKSVRIVGYFESDLQDRYDFVISEQLEQWLLQKPRKAKHIVTGTMPDEWIDAVNWRSTDPLTGWKSLEADPNSEERGKSSELSKLRSIALRSEQKQLVLVSDAAMTETEWSRLLSSLEQTMRDRTGVGSREFAIPAEEPTWEESAIVGNDRNDSPRYDLINVYVNDVRALRPVAALCDELLPGFNNESTINYDVIKRFESVNESFQAAISIANAQQGIILLLSSFCLIVLQVLRTSQKAPEFGMLRAMGMSKGSVLKYVFIQAFVIGLAGALAGIVLGATAAFLISAFLYDSTRDFWLGVEIRWYLPPLILMGTLVLSLLTSLASSLPLLRRSPAELMAR